MGEQLRVGMWGEGNSVNASETRTTKPASCHGHLEGRRRSHGIHDSRWLGWLWLRDWCVPGPEVPLARLSPAHRVVGQCFSFGHIMMPATRTITYSGF